MNISDGIYWDRTLNVIINPNCNCEVKPDCWFYKQWNRFKGNLVNWEFDDRGVGLNYDILAKTLNARESHVYSMNWWDDFADYAVNGDYIIRVIKKACLINMDRKVAGQPIHHYLFLTKQPQRLHSLLEQYWAMFGCLDKDGVWLGLSVTGLIPGNASIDMNSHLLIPDFKKFLSIEPLMGPNIPDDYFKHFNQIILGGHNGDQAPIIHPDSFKKIIDHADTASVPVFFKGWGEYVPGYRMRPVGDEPVRYSYENDTVSSKYSHLFEVRPGSVLNDMDSLLKVGRKKSGRLIGGKEYNNLAWRKTL